MFSLLIQYVSVCPISFPDVGSACIFPHCAVTGFSNFTFTFQSLDRVPSRDKGTFYLPWPWTSTCQPVLRTWLIL